MTGEEALGFTLGLREQSSMGYWRIRRELYKFYGIRPVDLETQPGEMPGC